ncbi:MAG TPA: hypothetical protein DCM08_03080, partial [Microscillaceae bacterium]|nr:hypothetical protein [Microscillaceae bacterium]
MSKRSFFFFLISLVQYHIYGQTPTTPTIIFNNTDQPLTIGKSIAYLKDESSALTIDDIVKPATQKLFTRYDRPIFAEPAQNGAYWFKFELENQTQVPLWLEVGSVYAWYVDFYRPGSTGQYADVVKTGTFRSEASKEFPANVFWLKLTGKSFQKMVYYLRIQTDTPLEVPLRIGSLQSLTKLKTINDFITAGFVGVMLILLVFSLFIYNNLRERIYLHYAGYLLASIFVLPFLNNYPFVQRITLGGLLTPIDWWKYYLGWSSFIFLFITLFSVNFLRIKHYHPYFYRAIMILFWATLLCSWSNFLGVTMAQISNPIQILTLSLYLSLFIAGILMSFKQQENAYFYISAWFFTLSSAIIFVLAINGIL